VEPGEQGVAIQGTGRVIALGHIDELDGVPTIQPPHQRDLTTAQGAAPVIPDQQRGLDRG
jgi:hypothetical protein